MEFKIFLRKRRDELNLSLQGLADALTRFGYKLERQTISNWENGKNGPPLKDPIFRKALAAALEIDLNEMMQVLGYVTYDESRSTEARQIADIADRLPEAERLKLLLFAQAVEKSLRVQNGG